MKYGVFTDIKAFFSKNFLLFLFLIIINSCAILLVQYRFIFPIIATIINLCSFIFLTLKFDKYSHSNLYNFKKNLLETIQRLPIIIIEMIIFIGSIAIMFFIVKSTFYKVPNNSLLPSIEIILWGIPLASFIGVYCATSLILALISSDYFIINSIKRSIKIMNIKGFIILYLGVFFITVINFLSVLQIKIMGKGLLQIIFNISKENVELVYSGLQLLVVIVNFLAYIFAISYIINLNSKKNKS